MEKERNGWNGFDERGSCGYVVVEERKVLGREPEKEGGREEGHGARCAPPQKVCQAHPILARDNHLMK